MTMMAMEKTSASAVNAAVVLLLLAGTAHPAAAQSSGTGSDLSVQDVLRFLVTNQGVQTSDFDKDREAAQATSDTLTRALLNSVATLPVSTSSSGFTYRLNPALGTVERASDTFGPFFVERALTAGGGQASFGFTVQYASFTSLDGHDLRSGDLVTTANQFTDEPAPFDVETLTLRIKSSTATFFGSVGVTDRIDVGVAVPLVRLDIDGSRENIYRGQSFLQARARAKSTGLADIAVRSKIRLTPDGPAALAAGVDVRLPTGREEDLLGAGDSAVRMMGLASAEVGAASVYGNLTVGVGGIGREVSYGGAVAVAAGRRLTLVGEAIARKVSGIQRITYVAADHPRIRGVTTTRLTPAADDQLSAFAVAGFKWNVGGVWLLHANVLLPITDGGLTARAIPTLAIDYSFAR
jgi:hypothetical protein